jgi:succinate-semialdehyde dehydrogenase/glutarate-semialdehyde dehydrogenase
VYPELGLYIGGEWLQAVLNPATEQSITNLWHATNADFECALAAAQRAFRTCEKLRPTIVHTSCASRPISCEAVAMT